ncbi:MAG: PAS domain S-box protein [Nitrospirae bacterium]|nr:PAS domain S-box protein [Nitrospirota bacterium]
MEGAIKLMYWLLIVAVITSVVIANFIIKSITSQLSSLNTAIVEIGGGNLDTRIEILSNDEIGQVAESFNNMAKELKDQHAELSLQGEINNNMAEGVSLTRASDGVIIHANPRFYEMFGYDKGEVIGKHVTVIIASSKHSPEETVNKVIESLKKYGYWHGEVHNVKKDGTEFWCMVTVSTFEHHQYGTVWISVRTDITEKKKMQEKLSKVSEEIFDLYNNAPCGYHSIDKDGIFLQMNDTELNWLGYTREEVIGKMKFSDLITTESLKTFQYNYPLFKQRGWVRDLEFEMIRKDESIMTALVSATAIKDNDGNYVMSRSTLYDITEIKNKRETIRELKERLEFAIEGSEQGAWDWNVQTGDVIMSPYWTKMLGYEEHELEHSISMVMSLMHPDDKGVVSQLLEKHFRGETDRFVSEIRYKHKDGSYRWILARGKVFKWTKNEKPLRIIGINTDITNIKMTQESLKRELQFKSALAEVTEALLLPEMDIKDIAEIVHRQALNLTDSKYGLCLGD